MLKLFDLELPRLTRLIEHVQTKHSDPTTYLGKSSVRVSVTLRYRGYIGWNSSKVISWLNVPWFSLFADSNITDLLQRKHLKFWPG